MFRLRWKPLDGWRRFFGEVGIIILGVLVALGLGAVATEVAWRNEVAQAREALGFEIGETIGQGRERINFAPCVERRLDQLAAIISEADRTGRLAPVGAISQPPWRTWNSGIWESAIAAQTARHFPREEAVAIVSFYEFVTLLRNTSQRELDAWNRLHGLVGPGRQFGPEEAARLNAAVGEARFNHRLMALSSIRSDQIAGAYALRFDAATAREYSDRPPASHPICLPIATEVPAAYGQAQFEDIIQRARDNPITRRAGGGGGR